MKSRWPILNLLVTFISIGGVYLITSGVTPLKSMSETGNRNEFVNLTLPPGFTFSIWGFIYLGFIFFGFLQLREDVRTNSRFQDSRALITLSIGLNLLWIILSGLEMFYLPYLLQWIMLAIAISIVLRTSRNDNPFQSNVDRLSFITFTLYAGWLTVAMIPYTTDVLLATGWRGDPLSPEIWAIIVYLLASAIVLLAFNKLKAPSYTLPLTWAFFGLAVKFSGPPAMVAGILSAAGLLWFIIKIYKNRYSETDGYAVI